MRDGQTINEISVGKITMTKNIKQVKRLIGLLQFFRNYIPKLGEKLIPFYRLLRRDTKIVTTDQHARNLQELQTDLLQATKMTLRLPKPGLQYILLL